MASLLEDPGYIHSAGPEEILDPRTTCLLGLCIGEFHNGLPERSLHMGEEGKAITCIQTQPSTRQRGFWLICPFMCLSNVYIKVNFRVSLLWIATNTQISFSGRKRNSQKLLPHNHSCHTQGRAADERFLSVSAPAEVGVSLRGMPNQTARCFLHHVWEEGSEGADTGMDTCTCQRGKFTKSLMPYNGTFSFGSNGSLDWPEPQLLRNSCPRADSRARR